MNQPKVKYSLSNWDLVSVNPNYKTWNWKDLFCYWGVNVQSVIGFALIASLYIMYDLNSFVVLLGTLLGSFFVYLFANFIGKPSQKFGLPFVVLLRSSLGFNGAPLNPKEDLNKTTKGNPNFCEGFPIKLANK